MYSRTRSVISMPQARLYSSRSEARSTGWPLGPGRKATLIGNGPAFPPVMDRAVDLDPGAAAAVEPGKPMSRMRAREKAGERKPAPRQGAHAKRLLIPARRVFRRDSLRLAGWLIGLGSSDLRLQKWPRLKGRFRLLSKERLHPTSPRREGCAAAAKFPRPFRRLHRRDRSRAEI